MKQEILSRVTLPLPKDNPHVVERVKVTLTNGYYVFERTHSSWSVVEEERFINSVELIHILTEHEETGKLPDDLPAVIDAMIVQSRKLAVRKEKVAMLQLAQRWADTLKVNNKSIFNQIY